MTKHPIHCKKTFIIKDFNNVEIGIIEKDKTYHYYSETSREGVDIFVYYDENNIAEGCRGYTFYHNLNQNNAPLGVRMLLISDYFYSNTELRKQKLLKLNQTR